MTPPEDADRLTEHALAALNAADPIGLVASILQANELDELDPEFRVDPEQEYRIEAEAIARGIRSEERGTGMLDRRKLAPIVKSVIDQYFSVRMPRRDALEIADAILEARANAGDAPSSF